MSPQLSSRQWVTLAAGIVVAVTAPILVFLTASVFRKEGLEAGRVVALATLMVSAAPLILRAARRVRGGPPEGGARLVWEVAIVVGGALLFLFMLVSSPPVIYDECGLTGDLCRKESNSSSGRPDGTVDDSPPPSTPPLTR